LLRNATKAVKVDLEKMEGSALKIVKIFRCRCGILSAT
jgi:hypothetical protein